MTALSPEVANKFIELAANDSRRLTNMQLQKLVYIAHGWNLAIFGNPLTSDVPEAWDFGPVYPELYDALKRYGRDRVSRPIQYGDFEIFPDDPEREAEAKFSTSEAQVIEKVHTDYGKFPAFKLSALTHMDGTPWDKVYNDLGNKRGAIDGELIKEHFIELANARG